MSIKLFYRKQLCLGLGLFLVLVCACRTVVSDSNSYQYGAKGEKDDAVAKRDYVIVETNDKKNIKLPLFIVNQMDTLSSLIEDLPDVLDESVENTETIPLMTMSAKELKLVTDLLAINTETEPKQLTTADVAAAIGNIKHQKNKDRCLKLLLDSNFLAAEDLLEKTAFYLATSLTVKEIYLLGGKLPPCKGKACVESFTSFFKTKPKGYVLPPELVDRIIQMKIGVKAVAAGFYFTCVIRYYDDMVQCWGSDEDKQNDPYNAAQGWRHDQAVKKIALGMAHGCAITMTNKLKCWGWNKFKQCQIKAPLSTTDIQYMSVGSRQYQVITADGEVRLCGFEESGKLAIPEELVGKIKKIEGGQGYTCALTTDGNVKCWGDKTDESQRGHPDGLNLPPTDLGPIKQLFVGILHACIIDDRDELRCWGRLPEQVKRQTPIIPKPHDLKKVREVALGHNHTCVRKWDNTPVCWGINRYNQVLIPEAFVGMKVKAITAGYVHTCMILYDDTVHCFGNNDKKQTDIPANLQGLIEEK